MSPLIERVVALTLLPGDRDVVLGDLREECAARGAPVRGGWLVSQCLRIAGRFHLEPYRAVVDLVGILAILLAGVILLWVVPAVGSPPPETVTLYRDALSRAALAVWSASHLTAASAAGLLVGRASLIPEHCAPARWHVATLLAVVSAAVPGAPAPALSAALLLAAAWFGDRARRAVRPTDSPSA
jgi:hypothetical protein